MGKTFVHKRMRRIKEICREESFRRVPLSSEENEVHKEFDALRDSVANGWKLERRRSAAHRKCAAKTKKICKRAEKRSDNFDARQGLE